jgi:SLT domain-containing protein
VQDVWRIIRPIFDSIGSGIKDITKGIKSVSHLAGGIGHAVGGIAHAIGLASGGIVTSPTLAVVGEAGPEAVLPLTDPRRAQTILQGAGQLIPHSTSSTGTGQTVIIDLRGSQVMSDRDLSMLIDKISAQLTKVIVPQGNVVIRH